MSEDRADLNELRDDFRKLSHLIDVIADLTFERHEGFYPDHVDSLLWVARAYADGIVKRNGDAS